MKPHLEIRKGGIKTVRIKTGPWRDVMLWVVGKLDSWDIILSTEVCGVCFVEPDMILMFKIYFEVFGEGTRLAMPKTICALDSSSLKPGSGATEGVPDEGVLG